MDSNPTYSVIRMDENIAFEELEETVESQTEENLEILNLISNINSEFKIVKINDYDLRVRPVIPRGTKTKIFKIFRKAGKTFSEAKKVQKSAEDDPEKLLNFFDEIYNDKDHNKNIKEVAVILSELCIDKPYTDPKVWIKIEEETSQIEKVFSDVLDTIMKSEESIGKFR